MTPRAIVRGLVGAALRALVAALYLEVFAVAVVLVFTRLWQPWWFDGGFRAAFWSYRLEPVCISQGLIALGFASMRLLEPLAARIRPDASYPRKLAAGLAIGVGVFVLTVAFVVEGYYVAGVVEKGTVEAALARVANGEWVSTRMAGEYRPGDLTLENLPGVALPFALAGFARARKLPLWEQTVLGAAFLIFWSGPALYFWTIASDKFELVSCVVFFLSTVAVPLVARRGDRLEERFMPRRLREPDLLVSSSPQ